MGTTISQHTAIIGLGMMGSSFAMAIRTSSHYLTGIDPDPVAREYALTHGIVDAATADTQAGVADADLVILAAPIRTMIELLTKRLGSYVRSNSLVLDLGSTKNDICEAMSRLPVGVGAVGGHPMTGKENSGIAHGEGSLFSSAPFVLCPSRRTTPAARARAIAVVEAVGAVPIEMDAARHDRIVAGISHLPYILSASLVGTISQEAEADSAYWQLAAGGFRDTSRLASSDIRMMSDILSTNTRAVATLLALFRVKLAQMEAMLIAGDEQALEAALLPIREARLAWKPEGTRK
jgi:prephenate dehydrogenase